MRYHLMSTAELKAVARRDGIEDYDKMSKKELLNRLYDFESNYGRYCTMAELRDEARSRGLSGYSELRKAQLIELLENDYYDNYEWYWLGRELTSRELDDDNNIIRVRLEDIGPDGKMLV